MKMLFFNIFLGISLSSKIMDMEEDMAYTRHHETKNTLRLVTVVYTYVYIY